MTGCDTMLPWISIFFPLFLSIRRWKCAKRSNVNKTEGNETERKKKFKVIGFGCVESTKMSIAFSLSDNNKQMRPHIRLRYHPIIVFVCMAFDFEIGICMFSSLQYIKNCSLNQNHLANRVIRSNISIKPRMR